MLCVVVLRKPVAAFHLAIRISLHELSIDPLYHERMFVICSAGHSSARKRAALWRWRNATQNIVEAWPA
jgi:hypothetical protein